MTAQNLRELVQGKPLTDAEIDTLLGAALGETNTDTATRSWVTPETIKARRKYLIAKLGARNITNAVALALSLGILNPDRIAPEEQDL